VVADLIEGRAGERAVATIRSGGSATNRAYARATSPRPALTLLLQLGELGDTAQLNIQAPSKGL
jgi:hypothetical protein